MSEKEIWSRNYRDAFIFLKERQNLEIYQEFIVFSEESTANESWLQKVLAIELIIVRRMILRQSNRWRTLFRRRKFDVLIESISLRILFTKRMLCFYKQNLFFLSLCVRSISHHLVIDIRVHSRFYRKIDKIVETSIDDEIACSDNDRVSW
jgi:hypothetical protein